MGEFEEWLGRKQKRRTEGRYGPLKHSNRLVDKIQFNTRDKFTISLRDIRKVGEELMKDFPFSLTSDGDLVPKACVVEDDEYAENPYLTEQKFLKEWLVRWLMPSAEKVEEVERKD